jgi:hypothetical protein
MNKRGQHTDISKVEMAEKEKNGKGTIGCLESGTIPSTIQVL